jgi:hypothetical protein
VAIDNDTAIVGTFAGAAYVFVRTGVIWGLQQKLTAGTVPGDAIFGGAVSLSGDTAVVGAFDQNRSAMPGRVYVFERIGENWGLEAELTAPDPLAGDDFGSSVAILGDTVLAGAPEDTALGLDAGSAYVFARNGLTWSRQAKLTAGDAASDDHFGYSVALADGTALIGTPRDDTPRGSDVGSAYVFIRNDGAWIQQAKLTALDGTSSDNFGMSVALLPWRIDDPRINGEQFGFIGNFYDSCIRHPIDRPHHGGNQQHWHNRRGTHPATLAESLAPWSDVNHLQLRQWLLLDAGADRHDPRYAKHCLLRTGRRTEQQ